MKNNILFISLFLILTLSSFNFAQYLGGSGSGYSMAQSQLNVPLPVELVSFSGDIVGNSISLNWVTETEVNNYGFEIEKAAADKIWKRIGFIQGAGNSNSPKYYSFSDKNIIKGREYFYRLKQIDTDGKFAYSIEVNITSSIDNYILYQNYPNPFNPSTKITFSIPDDEFVRLTVNDILGNQVAVLVNRNLSAGNHEVEFNSSGLPVKISSGIYFYRIEAGSFTQSKKMIILK